MQGWCYEGRKASATGLASTKAAFGAKNETLLNDARLLTARNLGIPLRVKDVDAL